MRLAILALVLAVLAPPELRGQRLEAQDGMDSEFAPFVFVFLVGTPAALGAVAGALVGWLAY